MIPPELEWLSNLIASILKILGIIAPIVNAIVIFMLPMLEPMGNALRNFILFVLGKITVGNFTWFILITAITAVVSITLAIFFPGEKEEKA
ncbi:MAG: hypothetical protein JW776_00725 [Candidatus Lokiarchaeota archaeon]|nr:hypothetical protein [Candidatus Lokiarchaeota archaeon]